MTRPRCYNRSPRDEGRWVQNGVRPSDLKPRWRWSPRWFEDRCATWDGTGIGPNGEPYPVANGWDCDGCRWDPRPKAAGSVGIDFVAQDTWKAAVVRALYAAKCNDLAELASGMRNPVVTVLQGGRFIDVREGAV